MHDFEEYDNDELRSRFYDLQVGPGSIREALEMYCEEHDEDCGWNSLDAIEAELTRRDGAAR